MPISELCKYCKRFNEATGECTKKSIERKCGQKLKLFIDIAPVNNDLPKKWDGIASTPVHAILSPMIVLTDPKRIMEIEIGD